MSYYRNWELQEKSLMERRLKMKCKTITIAQSSQLAQRILEEFQRKFVTRTAYTQDSQDYYVSRSIQASSYRTDSNYHGHFDSKPDHLTNEARSILGYAPSSNPLADELFNPNMPSQKQVMPGSPASLKSTIPQ